MICDEDDDDSIQTEQSNVTTKSNTESEIYGRRRDSSIKKILSNQPLEKQEYVGKLSILFFILNIIYEFCFVFFFLFF